MNGACGANGIGTRAYVLWQVTDGIWIVVHGASLIRQEVRLL